jgi:hypothetical protein
MGKGSSSSNWLLHAERAATRMVECQKKEQTLVALEPRQQKRQVICVSPFFLDQKFYAIPTKK